MKTTTTQEKSKMEITKETIKELSVNQLNELVEMICIDDRVILLTFNLYDENSFNKKIPWTISKINQFIDNRYYISIIEDLCDYDDLEEFEEEFEE